MNRGRASHRVCLWRTLCPSGHWYPATYNIRLQLSKKLFIQPYLGKGLFSQFSQLTILFVRISSLIPSEIMSTDITYKSKSKLYNAFTKSKFA